VVGTSMLVEVILRYFVELISLNSAFVLINLKSKFAKVVVVTFVKIAIETK
jgi:hypothetical protein